MLISIVKSLGTCFANESIHGNRGAVWHSENQVTDGLGFLKELKFVFRKGSRKKRLYCLGNNRVITIRLLETTVSCVHTSMFCSVFSRYVSSFDYVHTDFEAAFRC